MSKKLLILIGITFLLFLFLFLMLFLPKQGQKKIPLALPSPTLSSPAQSTYVFPTIVLSVPPTEKVIISDVTVQNFFKSAAEINTYGDVLITDTGRYHIVYQTKFNIFLLSILSAPFDEVKREAEDELVRVLGITRTDACRLSVSINTPAFANPEEAGNEYKLSFCT